MRKLAVLICFAAYAGNGGKYSERWLVPHALTNGSTVAVIKDSTLYVSTKGQRVDTANILECAGIAGCEKVVFMCKRDRVVKRVK